MLKHFTLLTAVLFAFAAGFAMDLNNQKLKYEEERREAERRAAQIRADMDARRILAETKAREDEYRRKQEQMRNFGKK